ncbi:MAG TPA: farnesyl diphosphate synthase [Xanthomonadaceae bacterium]|jgi:farnesyl diphosphate synthase|nr:farnesyl diphosphate synthase [Xanthomonadaceae bacterium]
MATIAKAVQAAAFDATFDRRIARLHVALDRSLPGETVSPQHLHAAMRYAVLGDGKRTRPQLVYAAGVACGAGETALDASATAVELVHAYSLIHDDLPAMDDDALRRGRATVHVAFDEATAILAGDALQALAFEVLIATDGDAALRIALISTLAAASGTSGMCGGQALDLAATGRVQTLAELERMHALKTGALFRASVRMGALCAHADEAMLRQLDDYAGAFGLAFQIRDDILDVEGSSSQLGKTAGKDAAQSKSTYPALLGLDGSRKLLDELAGTMRDALAPMGSAAGELLALGEMAVSRHR